MMESFLKDLIEQVLSCGCSKDEIRIVIVGDIFQQKIKASNEAKKNISQNAKCHELTGKNNYCCRKS